jgi:hypothetical protein
MKYHYLWVLRTRLIKTGIYWLDVKAVLDLLGGGVVWSVMVKVVTCRVL